MCYRKIPGKFQRLLKLKVSIKMWLCMYNIALTNIL